MIRYLASLVRNTDYAPELALSAVGFDSSGDIAVLRLRGESSGYWYDVWGGFNDLPTGDDLELFFGQFLQRVDSRALLESTSFSFLIENREVVFTNLPRPAYLYGSQATALTGLFLYASAPRDSASSIYPLEPGGEGRYIPAFLDVPSVPAKLSDPVSGATLATRFSFTLVNNDGGFDDTDSDGFLNSPTRIFRSDKDNPTIADFEIIRYGLVDYVEVDSTAARFTAADVFRTLTNPATDRFSAAVYPNAPNRTLDRSIPIGWGNLSNVPLFEVGASEYIALDPAYLTAVNAVYDRDGNSISFTVAAGIITATDAATADITGNVSNNIGTIITEIVAARANIPYVSGAWDVAETDAYIALAADVNLYFEGGSVKDLVELVLKNDLAFLITKADGQLTLRRWAETYATHTIPSWVIMAIPRKSNEEGKRYYISEVLIRHDLDVSSRTYQEEYFDGSRAGALLERYRQRRVGSFDSALFDPADITDFGSRLLNRFGVVSELVTIDLGVSAGSFDLLDTVEIDLTVNGRRVSNATTWIVREVDRAQDRVVLEAL